MLADPKKVNCTHERLAEGVYQILSFNLNLACWDEIINDDWKAVRLPDRDEYGYPKSCCGVADSHEQVLAVYPLTVADPARRFVLSITEVRKEDQEDEGWRWHKWGPYIGTETPTHEYLHDEPLIDRVVVYHWYELR